jgi:YHS domain-containing protein
METTPAPSKKLVDPVCGMTLDPGATGLKATYNDCTYYFCAETCRNAFRADPKKFHKSPKKPGWWERYLSRINRATGGKPPSCCG